MFRNNLGLQWEKDMKLKEERIESTKLELESLKCN